MYVFIYINNILIVLAFQRYRNAKRVVSDWSPGLTFWSHHLKVIEGLFGTSVSSYFKFIKWLFLINIPVFFIQFFFIVLPQILYRWFQREETGYHQDVSYSPLEILTGTVSHDCVVFFC